MRNKDYVRAVAFFKSERVSLIISRFLLWVFYTWKIITTRRKCCVFLNLSISTFAAGKRFITGSKDGLVNIFDTESGEQVGQHAICANTYVNEEQRTGCLKVSLATTTWHHTHIHKIASRMGWLEKREFSHLPFYIAHLFFHKEKRLRTNIFSQTHTHIHTHFPTGVFDRPGRWKLDSVARSACKVRSSGVNLTVTLNYSKNRIR